MITDITNRKIFLEEDNHIIIFDRIKKVFKSCDCDVYRRPACKHIKKAYKLLIAEGYVEDDILVPA